MTNNACVYRGMPHVQMIYGEITGTVVVADTVELAERIAAAGLPVSTGPRPAAILDFYRRNGVAVYAAPSAPGALAYAAVNSGAKGLYLDDTIRDFAGPLADRIEVVLPWTAGEARDQAFFRLAHILAWQVPTRLSRTDAATRLKAAGAEEQHLGRLNWLVELVRKKTLDSVSITSKLERLPLDAMQRLHELDEIVILKTGTGTGKTQAIASSIVSSSSVSVYIAHRRAIATSALSDVVADHYQTMAHGKEDTAKAIRFCVNSITKDDRFLNYFGWHEEQLRVESVYIDEAEQTLRHILTGTVDEEDRGLLVDRFVQLLRRSRRVVLADADASDLLVEFVRQYVPGRRIRLIEEDRDLSALHVEFCSDARAHREIKEAAATGKRLLIPCDSKGTAEKIGRKLKAEGLETLIIHSDTADNQEVRAFLANPNSEVRKYRAVVYSPLMSASVSITEEWFDAHIAIFSGVVTAPDCMQMLRRDRTATSFFVGLSEPLHADYMSEEEVLQAVSHAATAIDGWVARVKGVESFLQRNQGAALWSLLEAQGVRVSRLLEEEELTRQGLGFKSAAREVEEEYYTQKVLESAANISAGAVRVSHRAVDGERSEEAYFLSQARQIQAIYKTKNVTESMIQRFGRGRLATQLQNLRTLCVDDATVAASLEADKKKSTAYDHERLGLRRDLLRTVFLAFGVTLEEFEAASEAGEVDLESLLIGREMTEESARDAINALVDQRVLWSLLSTGIRVSESDLDSPIKKINRIFGAVFGLKSKRRQRTVGRDRVSIYAIDTEDSRETLRLVALSAPVVRIEAKKTCQSLLAHYARVESTLPAVIDLEDYEALWDDERVTA